jgi:hypothetical protein
VALVNVCLLELGDGRRATIRGVTVNTHSPSLGVVMWTDDGIFGGKLHTYIYIEERRIAGAILQLGTGGDHLQQWVYSLCGREASENKTTRNHTNKRSLWVHPAARS